MALVAAIGALDQGFGEERFSEAHAKEEVVKSASGHTMWRSANIVIRQHGDDAAVQAAMKADKFLAAADLDGATVWKRIVRAINDIARSDIPTGASRH